MRFTVEKVSQINEAYKEIIAEDIGLRVGDDALEKESAVYAGNWYICNVEDIDKCINALKLLKGVIQDETGVML